jgi:endonuclease/exonuclease/phosphatase family metal-dependent hydrolase
MTQMLRIMSYNIRFGGLGREDRIAEVINAAKPDLVILQEATHPRAVERLSKLAAMPHFGSRERYSVAFLSRTPVEHFDWHRHPELQRPVLDVKLQGLRVLGVHLRATHSNLTERRRMREVKAILDFTSHYKNEPHLLTGDFNTLAPGELLNMQKLPTRYRILAFLLGGRITFRALQLMIDAGYVDCYRRFHTDPGFTFPARDPHVRLDYFFAPREFIDLISTCDVFTIIPEPEKATDHLPLLTEVSLTTV